MPCSRFGLTMALDRVFAGWSQGQKWSLATALAAAALGGAYKLRGYWSSRRHLSSKQLVVLTGCDSGLGYSLAIHCRNLGATVLAGVLQEKGPAAVDLTSRGVKVFPLDITDSNSIQNFGDTLEKLVENEQLEFEALVNNAGVMIFGEFEWQLLSQARAQLEVNVLGTMAITRRLLPVLRRYSGRIVNVTSHCALAPLPGLAVYGATKAALQAWSTSLRVELAKYGVKVVSFIPGSFTKESNLLARQKKHFDDMRAAMTDDTRQFYGDYFEKYAEYLTNLPIETGLHRLGNPKVYSTFDGALLDQVPSAVYKCEPWRYTVYHTLFRIAPTYFLRDWLVERFVQMPAWDRSSRTHCDHDGKSKPPIG